MDIDQFMQQERSSEAAEGEGGMKGEERAGSFSCESQTHTHRPGYTPSPNDCIVPVLLLPLTGPPPPPRTRAHAHTHIRTGEFEV